MRIMVIGWAADEKNSGGMEVHIRELCKNLALMGHSVELSVPEAARGSIADLTDAAVKVRYIKCRTDCSSLDEVVKSVSQYNKKIIAEFKNPESCFDVIHSHDWLGIEAADFLSKKYRKPWIHTVHSLEHIRAADETGSPEKRISGIERRGIVACDRIITVSNLMKREITEKCRVPAEKISVIYNSATFSDAKSARNDSGRNTLPTVLFAGRLALQKGIEHLILAFAEALKIIPSARLVIAGSGNLDSSLKSLAASCGIEQSIIFKGFVSDDVLKELYRSADLFVSPSVFEPFGITVLDAAGFSVPVIATKNTGAVELFSKGSIAVVEPENSGALAGEIVRLLRNPAARKKMAEYAKKDLEKSDGWKKIAEKTADICCSTIENS